MADKLIQLKQKIKVYTSRDQRVILDEDLAMLYGVETRRLNEQVKRNKHKFPADFVFPIKNQELVILKSQNATSSFHGGRRKTTYAFTEHGAIMASMVLKSEKATLMSVYVVRAFTEMRHTLSQQEALKKDIAEQGKMLAQHDREITAIVETLDDLSADIRENTRKQIAGFNRKLQNK